MINQVVLMGRLTRDPELRYTNSGKAAVNFTIAVDSGYGENKTVSFINCIAWDKTAEFVSKYFTKGKMIIVIGRIQTRTWEGQGGRKNYVTEVLAREVNFGETKKSAGAGYVSQAATPQAQPNNKGYIFPPPTPDNFYPNPDELDDDLPF